jgi:hypothetical protein
MYTNRRAILFLVAQRRITPAEAERLIAACSCDREVWWLLAGCAFAVGLMQLEPHAFAGPQSHALFGMVHLFSPVINGLFPAIHQATVHIARIFGGNL